MPLRCRAVVRRFLFPTLFGLVALAIWWGLSAAGWFPPGTVPAPDEVVVELGSQIASGKLLEHSVASLYRVAWGYVGGVVVGVPLGLVIGRFANVKHTLLPWVSFFRALSPIAWIPFAILWFGIGDPPAIFIIFYTTMFVITVGTAAAASAVPRIYYRVAEDMGYGKWQLLFEVTLPAILPQLVIALRVAIGVAWMVLVAAEMLGVRNGLGYVIHDARHGQSWPTILVAMLTIGTIGIVLDILFARLQKIPSVRWGFER